MLDVRIPDASWGGVQQAAMGLAHGLSHVGGGTERFYFLAYRGATEWLRPLLKGSCELVEIEKPNEYWTKVSRRLWSLGLPRLARLVVRLTDRRPTRAATALGIEIVHFTHQAAFRTSARHIYQPHDLQHAHFPEFFSRHDAKRRDDLYRTNCRRSHMIAVMTRWGRIDIAREYRVDEAKIFVIPWAAPVDLYRSPTATELHEARTRHKLPSSYLIYPAQTWPHKNHRRLLQALAEVKARGLDEVHVVCTGHPGGQLSAIQEEAKRLGVSQNARFLGWVPSDDIMALYQGARGLIYPSLFEGWGMPVMEALRLGIPVACSRIPVLEEQARDAAIYFDPCDPKDIADAIISIWTDKSLRDRLAMLGRRRAGGIDWVTIAETFRAHYRRLAGIRLGDRDAALVDLSASGTLLP